MVSKILAAFPSWTVRLIRYANMSQSICHQIRLLTAEKYHKKAKRCNSLKKHIWAYRWSVNLIRLSVVAGAAAVVRRGQCREPPLRLRPPRPSRLRRNVSTRYWIDPTSDLITFKLIYPLNLALALELARLELPSWKRSVFETHRSNVAYEEQHYKL